MVVVVWLSIVFFGSVVSPKNEKREYVSPPAVSVSVPRHMGVNEPTQGLDSTFFFFFFFFSLFFSL